MRPNQWFMDIRYWFFGITLFHQQQTRRLLFELQVATGVHRPRLSWLSEPDRSPFAQGRPAAFSFIRPLEASCMDPLDRSTKKPMYSGQWFGFWPMVQWHKRDHLNSTWIQMELSDDLVEPFFLLLGNLQVLDLAESGIFGVVKPTIKMIGLPRFLYRWHFLCSYLGIPFWHMVNLDFQGIYCYHIYFYAVEPLKTNLSHSMAPGWLFGICIMGYDNCYSHNNFFLINMP